MQIISAMIETLDKPELPVLEGFRRIHLITNGLFWSEEQLQKLKVFKDYLLFAFSVDPKHHKASDLCDQKVNTLDEMFTGEHSNVYQYLSRIKETVGKVRDSFGEKGFIIQAVSGSEDNNIMNAANYFNIDRTIMNDTIYVGAVCTPKNTEWDPTTRQVTGNEDLIFIEKVNGRKKAYASFQDLLLGNPHAVLQAMIDR